MEGELRCGECHGDMPFELGDGCSLTVLCRACLLRPFPASVRVTPISESEG